MRQLMALLICIAYVVSVSIRDCRADQLEGYQVKLSVGIHQYILDNRVDFDGYSTSSPGASLGGATMLIARRNNHSSCADFPVCLNLVASTVSGFGTASLVGWLDFRAPDEESAADWLLNVVSPPGFPNIKVIRSIAVNGRPDDGMAIGDPIFSCAVTWSAENAVWAHEFGHMCGLAEGSDIDGLCGYNLMRDNTVQYRDQLTQSQAYTIENAISASQYASSGTLACDPTGVAGLEGIGAVAGSGGVEIRFSTIWEAYTAAFEVFRVDPESGARIDSLGTASWVPEQGSRVYSVNDPGGMMGYVYQIVEHQTSGRGDLTYGPAIARPAPAGGGGAAGYDADSLKAVVETYSRPPVVRPDPCSNRHELGYPEYEILCPDSLVDALQSYWSLWHYDRGVFTDIINKTMADSCAGGFREWIRWAAARNTKYFLLVGDANDHVMWDDSTRWTPNGWNWPAQWHQAPNGDVIPLVHIPAQPEKDLIPTFYNAVADSPQVSWTAFTPYYATDLPYADTDGDSLPDVIVGRLPASTAADITAYTAKLATWFSTTNGSFGNTAALLEYAVNHGTVPAWPTALSMGPLRNAYPPGTSVTQGGYEWFGTPTQGRLTDDDSIRAIANAAASGGASVIAWNLNSSDRYEYTGFWKIYHRDDNLPIWATNRPFISVALSCGMNNFDETERWDSTSCGPCVNQPVSWHWFNPVRPIVEKLLFDPSRSAIVQVGPTRGSQIIANPLFGEEFLKQLYTPGASVGRAFLLAQRACVQRYPRYRDLFKSYVLLGDPRLGPDIVTGVAGTTPWPGIRLSRPTPNPFNPWTRFRFFLDRPMSSSITIYDVHGGMVRRLMRETLRGPGWSDVRWDGTSDSGLAVASGVYFALLRGGGRTAVQRVVLLR